MPFAAEGTIRKKFATDIGRNCAAWLRFSEDRRAEDSIFLRDG